MEQGTAPASDRSQRLRLAGTIIALALLVYLLARQGWTEIISAVRQIEGWRLVLALGLMFISRLAVTARWYVLLRAGKIPITFAQTLRLTFAGLFASNFLPTTIGGDMIRMVGLVQLKRDPLVSASSLVVDRLVGMAGMAFAVPFSLPVLLGGQTGLFPTLALAIPSSNRVQSVRDSITNTLNRMGLALRLWLHRPDSLLLSLGFTGVHMLCLFSLIYLLLDGMGQQMPIGLIGGLYSLVYFVTLAPISFNGYGVQEISMTLIFSNLGRAPQEIGLTIALLFRTIMMLASLPGAVALPDILTAARKSPPVG